MNVISVINYKGGVGKTTVSANLAAEMAFRGKKVLAIDLDPQASLTFSFLRVDDWRRLFEKTKTIKSWFDAFIDDDKELDLSSLIVKPKRVNERLASRGGRVDLICSHLALINVDLELATRLSGASERQMRANFLRVHSRLKHGLASIEEGRYDVVLIDCPPNFNIVTKTAIVASDFLLVPAKPDYLSTLGIEQLQRHVAELVGDYNKCVANTKDDAWEAISPEIMGVLFTMVSVRNGSPISAQEQYVQQIKSLGIPTFNTMVRDNKTRYADAPEYGVPVVLEVAYGQTYESVREELEALATEVLSRLP
ncbi:ParA family protein [Corallococcus sp. 4LFB]|uniref:ParA family protein n=1 Tax=Corallococcus sp. 4LFB TaxID=3383249 RepID=UPI0039772002